MPARDHPSSVDAQIADLYEQTRVLQSQFAGLPKAATTLNMRTARGDTGVIAASSAADVTVSWAEVFPDLSYSAAVEIEENTVLGITVLRILSRTTASVTVRVQNNDPSAAHRAAIHLIAVHDV